MVELELKLIGAAEDVARFRRSGLVKSLRDGPASFERLVTTYYDTPRGDLHVAGVSLRLREEGGRLIQTMKRVGAGGSTVMRREEERAVGPGETFPVRPDDMLLAAALDRLASDLAPISRIITDRWFTELFYKGARIEAAFDIGRAELYRAGAVAAAGPIVEAELELIEGCPERLFALARRAVAESGGRLKLGAASKAEQARRMARPGAPPPETPVRLETDDTAASAFAAALAASAHRLADCQHAVISARAPEGVHQLRVALRRFRAVERLFRKTLRCEKTERLALAARAFSGALGPARDWDVFCDKTLPEIAASAGHRAGAGGGEGFQALAARAFALRAEAWDDAASEIAGEKFQRFLIDLNEAAAVQGWRKGARRAIDEPAKRFARQALDKRLARLRAMGAMDDVTAEARHEFRIELKKLRYAAQLFRPLFSGGGRKRYFAAIARLQDEFGALNDAAVAERLAMEAARGQGVEAVRAAGLLAGFCAHEAQSAAQSLADDVRAFVTRPPFWERTRAPRAEGEAEETSVC